MDRSRPYFFVHILKTAGTSFRHHLEVNFPGDREMYPERGLGWDEHLSAYGDIARLLALPPERTAEIGAYSGHFPYVASQLLGVEPYTLTLLRDPVDRTLSYLRHCRRHQPRFAERSLEEIYEDVGTFTGFVWNHQAKVFAMTADDPLRRIDDVIEIDDARLALAERNLEAVDVVGVTEHYDDFLDDVRDRFGWELGSSERRNVGIPESAPESLVEMIREDNAADLHLYDVARELSRGRRASRGA